MENLLEPILTYQMSQLEAKAYKIALLWDALCKKEFPDYKHDRIKKSGDPRKSLLFKYAYKLVNETSGLLEDKEYRLYLLSQLHILKQCTDGNVHALLGPQCFVGDKAWKRWRMWKEKFDRHLNQKSIKSKIPEAPSVKIKSDLNKTKSFLIEFFGKYPTQQDIDHSISSKTFIKWVTIGKVSPYYALSSPFVRKALGEEKLENMFSFDIDVYKCHIKDDILDHIKKTFNLEFGVN